MRTCATNISKELIIELILEKLTAHIVMFNKKASQGIDSFHELNEKSPYNICQYFYRNI